MWGQILVLLGLRINSKISDVCADERQDKCFRKWSATPLVRDSGILFLAGSGYIKGNGRSNRGFQYSGDDDGRFAG